MCSPYDFTRNFQKGISTLDIAEAYMYIWCKTTNFKWVNLFLRFFVNPKCFWQSNESSCIWLFDEIFAIVERRKGGNPKRATHAIYYRPCRMYTMDPPKSGKSRKRFKIHQEQKYVSVPHHARLPLITEARSKQPSKGQLISKANFLVLIWTQKRRNYFLISALASKNGSNQKGEGTLLY